MSKHNKIILNGGSCMSSKFYHTHKPKEMRFLVKILLKDMGYYHLACYCSWKFERFHKQVDCCHFYSCPP